MKKITIQNVGKYIPQNLASSEQLSDDAKVMLAVIADRSALSDDNKVSVARSTFEKMGGLSKARQYPAEFNLCHFGLIRFRRGGIDTETGKVYAGVYEILPDAWNKPLVEVGYDRVPMDKLLESLPKRWKNDSVLDDGIKRLLGAFIYYYKKNPRREGQKGFVRVSNYALFKTARVSEHSFYIWRDELDEMQLINRIEKGNEVGKPSEYAINFAKLLQPIQHLPDNWRFERIKRELIERGVLKNEN